MNQSKVSARQALLRAVSALGISLGVTAVAVADEAPKEGLNASSYQGKHSANQLKLDSHQLKYDSNQLKYRSNQYKERSNQLKLDSTQQKHPAVGHELNPQPLPPG